MSEYWKSTPKFWCKFCKQFVRDTKFDKQQHEATPRHQGNIQRSLRTLHRDQEREERNTQRAKDEVARLNGIVSGASASAPSSSSGSKNVVKPNTRVTAPPVQATLQDRKKQLAQLAEMGVAIPQEYRAEMALAGEWETIPSKANQQEDIKPKVKNIGVHKRKLEDTEEDGTTTSENIPRKGWGSTTRTYPDTHEDSGDIEALFSTGEQHGSGQVTVKEEEEREQEGRSEILLKKEETAEDAPVVFKKRKSKAMKAG